MGSTRILVAPLVALLLAAAGCTAAVSEPADEAQAAKDPQATPSVVSVLGSWEGPEADTFRALVGPFEEETGLRVEYISTRDLAGALEARIAAGDPPDVAGLPGPGALQDLARAGHLADLGTVVDAQAYKRDTAPVFVDLGTVDGKLVGVFLKGTVKGLIWFDPDVYHGPTPASWVGLQHEATSMSSVASASVASPDLRSWCVGLASDETSGWPGTDWIEDFVLRQSGPGVYDAWVSGTLPWTSADIRWAFQSYGLVVDDVAVAGGAEGALKTHFSRSGDGLLSDPPTCLFLHQGSFMAEFLDEAVERWGGRYDVMPFPDIDPRFSGALIGAGDLLALTNDSAGGRELMRYLVSAEAQQGLVRQSGALSGNLTVTDYPDELQARLAQLLASASIFRFDASDSMPSGMEAAFRQAVLDFTADQTRLDDILRGLETVRAEAYGSP